MRRLRGDLAVVEASYKWVLGRIPSPVEAQQFLRAITEGDVIEEVFRRLLTSEEHRFSPRILATPFDGAFPFDTEALDEV